VPGRGCESCWRVRKWRGKGARSSAPRCRIQSRPRLTAAR
jgi:hypothetical protein